MIKHARDWVGTVIDLDDMLPVPHVVWVDVEAGLIEFCKLIGGRPLRDERGDWVTCRARGRFFADLRPRPGGAADPRRPSPRHLEGAAACHLCGSSLVLAGDDLCPFCRARQRGVRFRVEPVTDPLAVRACDGGCGRAAEWQVGDEIGVSCQVGAGPLGPRTPFARGCIVGRRWWCSRCWRPPRILDARGEVIREDEDAGGARPS